MRALALFSALALSACSGDVRDTKISDVDFTDPSSVQAIAQKLEPAEREQFNTYVLSRTMAGNLGIKEIVTADGKEPPTVREALALSKIANDIGKRRGAMMKERNALVEKRNALIGDGGLLPKDKAEWDRLGKEVDEFDRKLSAP